MSEREYFRLEQGQLSPYHPLIGGDEVLLFTEKEILWKSLERETWKKRKIFKTYLFIIKIKVKKKKLIYPIHQKN